MEDAVALFRELVSCGVSIYTWVFDGEGEILESNCPDQAILSEVFEYTGCKDTMYRLAVRSEEQPKPMLLGGEGELVWGAAYQVADTPGVGGEARRSLERCYAIGPVFFSEQPKRENASVFTHTGNSAGTSGSAALVAWNRRLGETMRTVPVVPSTLFMRNLLMLHYCITREKLDIDAVSSGAFERVESAGGVLAGHDRRKVWLAEQALLGAVRTGDLDYRRAYRNSTLLSSGVPVYGRDPLRQMKTSLVVFTSLVVRAAMEGGLSPEVAYPLGDSYIQRIESATSVSEVMPIGPAMYDDFIGRVHERIVGPALSYPVRVACDYIDAHVGERVRADDLARAAGYSAYYLTRRFREETGVSVSSYVRRAKLERAKVLLLSTDLTVQEIARELHFSSRSHFCRVFSDDEGCTPGLYRKRRRNGYKTTDPLVELAKPRVRAGGAC